MKTGIWMLALLLALPGYAAELYRNDFEQNNDVAFYAVCAPDWIGNRERAEQEGFIKIHRAGLSEFGEKNHDGVLSYALDLSLLKGDGKWGPICMFRGGKFQIPFDRPLWLSAYLYPEELPPDVTVDMGIVFTFEKDGKRVGGTLPVPALGRNGDNFLVYCADLRDILKDRFQNVILESWMVRLHSRKPFHGQRVRLFLDDVVLGDAKPDVTLSGLSGERLGNDIRKNAADPYTVDYTSLYREYPKNAANVVFNGSFELGMKDWYPRATRPEGSLELPDPAAMFRVTAEEGAPDGKRVFSVTRNGKPSAVTLGGRPYKIEDGKDYVLSFYAKASKDGEVLRVNSSDFKLTTGWQRYVVNLPGIQCYETWGGKKFPGRFSLVFRNSGDADLALDAIQLEKAPLTGYAGSGILEIAAKPRKQFGLYAAGEKPEFEVEYFNSGDRKRTGRLTWELKDHLHRVLETGEREISAGPQSGGAFTIPVAAAGNFCKLFVRLSAADQPEQSAVTSAARIPDLTGIKGNEFFGHCALEGSNPPNLKYTLELNRKLGMSFAAAYHLNHPRAPKNWREENPLLKQLDDLVAICDSYGMELIWSNYQPFPPDMAKDGEGVEIVTPQTEADVRDYAELMAKRYRGKIRYFEYFGEYLKDSLPKQSRNVDRLVRAAAEGLKKGNPDAILLTPGQHRMNSILTVFPALAKLGTFRAADRISLHAYDFGSGLASHNTLENLKRQIGQYTPGMKVVNSEAGACSTDVLYYDDICGETLNYPAYKTELEQAVWDVRAQVAMFGSGIFEKSALFYSYEGNVGGRKFYHFVNPDNDLSPRPVFPAYATLVGRLSGANNVGEFQQREKNGLQGYLFSKDGRYFAALWRYTPDHIRRKTVIPLPPERVKAQDLVGNPLSLNSGGRTELVLGNEPVWLDFEDATEAELLRALNAIHVVFVEPELFCDGKTLTIQIANPNAETLAGSLFLNSEPTAEKLRIAPGEVRKVTVPLKHAETLPAWRAVFRTESGEEFKSREVRFLPVAKAAGPVVIDGDLREYAAAVPFRLGAAQAFSNYGATVKSDRDLGATARFLYDGKNFYLAVEVEDDIHRTPNNSANRLWANDALQLLFVMSGNPNALNSDIVELAVSDTADGPKAAFGFGARSGFADFSMHLSRKGERMVYELAIPWTLLQPGFVPGAAAPPLFNLAVSDNDGKELPGIEFLKGYEKSLQMNRGVVDRKDPAAAPQLCFLPPQ